MAPPYPYPVLPEFHERSGLRIVDQYRVGFKVEFLCIGFVDLVMVVPHIRGYGFREPLKSVMHFFRNVKESRVPFDNLPSRVDPEFCEDRDHPLEDLCDASTLAGRVYVEERPLVQFFPEHLQQNEVAFRHNP